MSVLGDILGGVSDFGGGVYTAKANAAETQHQLALEEEKRRLLADQLRQDAQEKWFSQQQRRYANVQIDDKGQAFGVDTFTGQWVPVPRPTGSPDFFLAPKPGPKPPAPEKPRYFLNPEGGPMQMNPETGKVESIPVPKGYPTRSGVLAAGAGTRVEAIAGAREKLGKAHGLSPIQLKDFQLTGKFTDKMPAAMQNDLIAITDTMQDAKDIMGMIDQLTKHMRAGTNSLGNRITNLGVQTMYLHGFDPGPIYGQLASRLSRFGVMQIGASTPHNGRISKPIIELLTPHIPDMGRDTTANIIGKMRGIMRSLENKQNSIYKSAEQYQGIPRPGASPDFSGDDVDSKWYKGDDEE